MSIDTGQAKSASQAVEVRTTCPRDCYDACGVVVMVRPGAAPIVRGDRGDPVSRGKLCRKCSTAYNGVLLDPSARLGTPLRRVGPKGDGRFAPISWDDALGEIAGRLADAVVLGGPESILNVHYSGTLAMIGYHFPQRFFNRLGATEVDPDTVCNKAGHVALKYLYGTSLEGFDPRTARDATSILVWGANPSACAPHQHEHWLPEAPGKVVVVDPLRTETAREAALHLQVAPGSDAALAFAIAHVLWRDGLCDERFIADHTVGFEELVPSIERCSPRWAQERTGIQAARIEEAAHIYGAGPSLVWIGQGLQRQPNGGNVVRSVAMLPAITGNLARAGSGFLYLNGYDTRGIDGDYLTGSHLASLPRATISQMDLAATLEDEARSRVLFCWNINIAASSPEQRRLRAALSRQDLFTVVIDLFQTDTADYADIVLPATSFLEHDDLVLSYFHQSIGAQVGALPPPGDALPNSEIFRRLAAKMEYENAELFESDEEILGKLMEQSGTGLRFEDLATRGTVWAGDSPRLQFPQLAFLTPSGRIELASATAEHDGLPRVPEPTADAAPTRGRLRLLSPASSWTLNDSYGNDALIRTRLGPQSVTVHPREAERRRLSPGQVVRVANDVGELVLRLATSDDVPERVALIEKGRWPKLEETNSNVNILNPGHKADMGESSAVHGIEVTLQAVRNAQLRTGAPPAVT